MFSSSVISRVQIASLGRIIIAVHLIEFIYFYAIQKTNVKVSCTQREKEIFSLLPTSLMHKSAYNENSLG